jgi:hypothetical protein
MVHIEPITTPCSFVRIFAPDAEYGRDPWVWGGVLKHLGEGVVELCLVQEPPTRKQMWELVKALRAEGITTIIERRLREGRLEEVRHDLTRGNHEVQNDGQHAD